MLVRALSLLRAVLKSLGLLPLIKRVLYAPGAKGSPLQNPRSLSYRIKALIEQANFAAVTEVHDLPEIHQYWSDNYLLPRLASLNYRSSDDFFIQNIERVLRKLPSDQPVARIVSIGSGNCDFEIGIAQELIRKGYSNFLIHCIDFNQQMLDRGMQLAKQKEVGNYIAPIRADFNEWVPELHYDAALASMSLHHVVSLEDLFDRVKAALQPHGLFIVSDMIGRNGHMRWPEALEIVNEFWRELPESYRFNRMLAQHQDSYVNFDCSRSGFEGIRAQDILPLLVERFHFESFISYANVVEVFIDRAMGYNFDPAREWDRSFIDRVNQRDEEEMRNGRLKPTHMLAAMSVAPNERCETVGGMSASFAVRRTDVEVVANG